MLKDYNLNITPANQQRRPQNAMDDKWTSAFLEQAQVAHIATHWDEQPFITPTNFWFDPEKREIYFHSNIVGRTRANAGRHPQVCLEVSDMGRLLPANTALEFSVQYQGVIVFGKLRILEDPEEQRRVLHGLIKKYFPGMEPGVHYRPATDQELARTSVYAIEIESWSGKRNWKEQAVQSEEWRPLT